MSGFIAALPMYDWAEAREAVDAEWAVMRRAFRAAGVDAPRRLARRNGDMPAVPGGVRDRAGAPVAPDPAMLPPEELDVETLWRHPQLLLAQTCWGPMEMGLSADAVVVAQPDYSAFEGGQGTLYSSAILMRRSASPHDASAPAGHGPCVPVALLRGVRFAYNGADSMSGMLALGRDLAALGFGMEVFSQTIETGGHRASIVAVAEGRADACAVDCRSLDLARRFEKRTAEVAVVGWTAKRKGLPLITSRHTPAPVVARMRAALGRF